MKPFPHRKLGRKILTLPKKNKALNQVINNYIDNLESAGSSSLGDFYEQRAQMHI